MASITITERRWGVSVVRIGCVTARDGSYPRLRSVLVKLRPSNVGDPEAGWFLRDTSGRTVLDQSVKRIRQAVIVEPGPGGRLKDP